MYLLQRLLSVYTPIRAVVLSVYVCVITTGDSGEIKIINMATGFMSIFTKLEKYDGKEDLTSWFKKFERCSIASNSPFSDVFDEGYRSVDTVFCFPYTTSSMAMLGKVV